MAHKIRSTKNSKRKNICASLRNAFRFQNSDELKERPVTRAKSGQIRFGSVWGTRTGQIVFFCPKKHLEIERQGSPFKNGFFDHSQGIKISEFANFL